MVWLSWLRRTQIHIKLTAHPVVHWLIEDGEWSLVGGWTGLG